MTKNAGPPSTTMRKTSTVTGARGITFTIEHRHRNHWNFCRWTYIPFFGVISQQYARLKHSVCAVLVILAPMGLVGR